MLPVVGAEPKDGGSFAGSIEMSMLGAVQRRVGEAFGGQHLADQEQVRGTLGDILPKVAARNFRRTALILVGEVLAAEGFADSSLYRAEHRHLYRPGE